MRKLLIGLIEGLLKGDLKEDPNMKVVHREVMKKMDSMIHRVIIDTLATLHGEMVMIMVDVTMFPKMVVMDTGLVPFIMDVMDITLHLVVMTVVPR